MSNSNSWDSAKGRQRGQIFSIDLIIAMSLVILGVGLLFNAANMRAFEAKESFLANEMQDKANAAAIALSNGPATSCSLESSPLAYTLDLQKIGALNGAPGALKRYMGLEDHNVSLSAGSSQILGEALNGKNIVALDVPIMLCANSGAVTMHDGNLAGLSKQTLSLKVTR